MEKKNNFQAHADMVDMIGKITKQKTLAKTALKQVEDQISTAEQAKKSLGEAIQQADETASQKCQKCCAKCKEAIPIILGVTQALSTLAQAGLQTAGTITGDPTLTQASNILGESQNLLNSLGEQLASAQSVKDYLKLAGSATGDALKIAGGATKNSQLSDIGAAVISTSDLVSDLGNVKDAKDAIKKLSDAAAEALSKASDITGDDKLKHIGNIISKIGDKF